MTPRHRLALRQPLPWSVLLGYLQPRLIGDRERIDGDAYERRTAAGTVRVSLAGNDSSSGTGSGDALEVEAPDALTAIELRRRVGALFAIDEDPRAGAAHLQRDPLMAPRLARLPGLRPLGGWDAFELCLRTVLGQQVSVAAAGTLMRRLQSRCGDELTPARVRDADLSAMGLTTRRAETLKTLARAVDDGALDLTSAWPHIERVLHELPGFGPWTRDYLAIRLGRQPDAFPHTDLGLVRAAGADSPHALLRQADAWRPYRALAAVYLWAG
ncbi:MAG TPA: AlkA N-terminal domain-containing protein [Solimonas sp.]